MNIKLVSIIASGLLVTTMMSGCAMHTGNIPMADMEKKQYTDPIVDGKSTKADISKLLGDPQRVDALSGNGNESKTKWTYDYTRTSWKFVNYIPIINWFVSGTNDTTKQISIVFDKNSVVENHDTTKAQGETMRGLFQ